MDYLSALRAGFSDELEKIAAVRLGRPPFTAATMAKAKKLTKKGVLTKLSAPSKKTLALIGGSAVAGGYVTHKGKQAVDDYRTGRAMRKAQVG